MIHVWLDLTRGSNEMDVFILSVLASELLFDLLSLGHFVHILGLYEDCIVDWLGNRRIGITAAGSRPVLF